MKTAIELIKKEARQRGMAIDDGRVFELITTVCEFCCVSGWQGGCHPPPPPPKELAV